jgi:hypothetical protein
MNIRRVYWGIVLILLGVLGLGVTLGWFTNVNIWALIGPFFLIALGIWFLIRPRFPKNADFKVTEDAIALEGAKEAKVSIEHGAGKLTLRAGAKEGELLGGTFSGGLKKKVSVNGGKATIKLESEAEAAFESAFDYPGGGLEWTVNLTPAIPLILDLDTGASELVCDLTDLKVKEFDLDTGASSSKIILPAKAGYTLVDIDAGAASVEMTVPEGVSASIKVEAALMKKTIDEQRFPFNGERYLSPDYETAENKVEIKIDSAVGSISVQ